MEPESTSKRMRPIFEVDPLQRVLNVTRRYYALGLDKRMFTWAQCTQEERAVLRELNAARRALQFHVYGTPM